MNEAQGPMRLDKVLWSVRLYKTRAVAAEALRRGKVSVAGRQVKSSHTARVGEVITVKVPGGERSFRLLAIPKSRVGAKLVADFLLEVTPEEQTHQLEVYRLQRNMLRDRGLGRPTKRDRRDIDDFFANDDDELDIDLGGDDDDTND